MKTKTIADTIKIVPAKAQVVSRHRLTFLACAWPTTWRTLQRMALMVW